MGVPSADQYSLSLMTNWTTSPSSITRSDAASLNVAFGAAGDCPCADATPLMRTPMDRILAVRRRMPWNFPGAVREGHGRCSMGNISSPFGDQKDRSPQALQFNTVRAAHCKKGQGDFRFRAGNALPPC